MYKDNIKTNNTAASIKIRNNMYIINFMTKISIKELKSIIENIIKETGASWPMPGEEVVHIHSGRWQYIYDADDKKTKYYHLDCDSYADNDGKCISCSSSAPGSSGIKEEQAQQPIQQNPELFEAAKHINEAMKILKTFEDTKGQNATINSFMETLGIYRKRLVEMSGIKK